MALEDVRKRLPVVDFLPAPDSRRILPVAEGELPKPRLVVWEITLKCDQKCIHCGSRAGPARPGELTTEEALKVVEELAELGAGEVVLVGGEAYLRNDFILIIRAIRDAGMAVTMTSGGLNLTPQRCEAMAEAGVLSVNVSIDGLEEAHDRLRGVEGSWRKAFAALDNLGQAGIKRAVNSQINALTMHDLLPLLEKLHEAGIFAWQLQITAPFGNAGDNPDILLQPYMYNELFEILDRVADRCLELGIIIWPANNLGYFGPFEAKLRKFQKKGSHYKGCAAGRASMGIEADGAIKGCPSLGGPENIGGYWRDHGLKAIWAQTPQLTYMRERGEKELWGYCAECYYASVCKAGCTAVAEPLMGRPGNNPFCHHRAMEMERMGMRERIELVEKGPGLPFDHGLYRIVREYADPHRRESEPPVQIDEPRTSRTVDRMGPGKPVR